MTSEYVPACPDAVGDSHVYGSRDKCLVCGKPAGPKPRLRRVPGAIDREVRARPGTLVGHPLGVHRADGIEDVAGWGEDGDPWTS